MVNPKRGDIWLTDFDPTRGREQAGKRPALIVSTDRFNSGPAQLVIVIPITSKAKGTPSVVLMKPPADGVREASYAKPEDVRSISKQRLLKRWGSASVSTMQSVESWLRTLMEL
jgi:mRNA interferase MazF